MIEGLESPRRARVGVRRACNFALWALGWAVGIVDVALAEPTGPSAPSARSARNAATSPSVTLDEVLASVDRHPALVAQDADRRAAEARLMSAEGGFDPVLSGRAEVPFAGYYDGPSVDVSLEQPTPLYGATVGVGYRIGRPTFPVYDGKRETLSDGELRGYVNVPILRDGIIDGRRAAIASAEQSVEASRAGVGATQVRLRREAREAYASWVAAVQVASASRASEQLAQERLSQIETSAARGAMPAIDVLESRRTLLARRQARVRAERSLREAALALSLYLRDAVGRPRVLPIDAAPPERDTSPDVDETGDVLRGASLSSLVRRARDNRPDRRRAAANLRRLRVQVALAENRVLPRLDARLGVSRDLGGGTDDQVTRLGETVVEGTLQLSVPLLLRESRGALRGAEADRAVAEAELQALDERIAVEIGTALAAAEAAQTRVELAVESAFVSRRLAEGERTRFDAGATTLFVLNLREQAWLEADIERAIAIAEQRRARAQLRAALGER